MSNQLPSAKEVMEQVDALRKAVHEVAAREQQAANELKTGTARLRQRLSRIREEGEGRLAEQLLAAEDDLRTERLACNARYERRKAVIARSHKSARQHRAKEIEKWEGNRKYETQKGLLQAERDQESRLKAAEEHYRNFSGELAVEAQTLARLEADVRHAFGGYGALLNLLEHPAEAPAADTSQEEQKLLGDLRKSLGELGDKTKQFSRLVLPALFRGCPLWLMILILVLVHAPLKWVMPHVGYPGITFQHVGISFGVTLGLVLVMYFMGQARAKAAAQGIARSLAQARQLYAAAEARSLTRRDDDVAKARADYTTRTDTLNDMWPKISADVTHFQKHWEANVAERLERTANRNERLHHLWLDRHQQAYAAKVERLKQETVSGRNAAEQNCVNQEKLLADKFAEDVKLLETEWRSRVVPVYETLIQAGAAAEKLFPDWQSTSVEAWKPPQEFVHAARFGRLDVDVAALAGSLPQESRLQLPGPARFNVPLMLRIPHEGSLVFETRDGGRDEAMRSLNNVILRLLTSTPPGKASFTIIDPVELGQNFAGLMHLTDYEARLINDRIWTQTAQIEQRLADLNEHIEKVTQMYLRNEYESITEYNVQAGRIAEKYHFLVVADFPSGFSDLAARRLLSIAASGGRCGVYTLIHWDQRKPLPHDFVADQLRANSICLRRRGDAFGVGDRAMEGTKVVLDAPADAEKATGLLHKVGQSSIDSNRVEMPFHEIAPKPEQMWSLDTAQEMRVAIGRTGATKLQYMALGKGTRQHALLAGKTGSGKSTLFHVMITNLAMWFSPDEVEFYLVDFKKGVEFKCYGSQRLPHARVVAVESDREFGLSVLQRVDDELKRRGDMFRKLGVQDMAGYRRSGAKEPLPRTLLLIDEFQEFFTEDDRVSQSAALLLDRIVRQGRAFGVHVLLGSQTLGGAYTLARTTLGQMVVRIALQCNEADAYLIMDEDNSAPRLLSRPGEAIYNDAAGAVEGNSPFQIVWLGEDEREGLLKEIRTRADQSPVRYPGPVVFEGNAPSDVRENLLLADLLAAPKLVPAATPRIWLGAPNSIKGPTEAVFLRQSGNNLLVVGQRDEAVLAMEVISLVCLAAQHPRGSARFMMFDCTPPGMERDYLERAVRVIPHDVKLVNNAEIDAVMAELAEELNRRNDPEYAVTAPAIYLFIGGIQRFKKLRYDEDFEFSIDASRPVPPGSTLNKLICEGTSVGIHVICTCDTANNLTRSLSRKAISEFEMRILFQMSATDSATLIDSPKAGNLGLHRAVFSNGKEGYLETFRPYAPPDSAWVEEAAAQLQRLQNS